jgi:excisionase family DNA binding protein
VNGPRLTDEQFAEYLRATTIPRRALSPIEAAAALGVSRDFLDEHVLDELHVVREGRKLLIPVVEIDRWLERRAALTLGGER